MIDWTKGYSGWEVLANGASGLLVTAVGVFIALVVNGWRERQRDRRRAITEARELVDELMRLSLENAPRSPGTREMLWPRASRTMEIMTGMSVVEPWLPSYFQNQALILLEASGDRAQKKQPKTTDEEREIRTKEVGELLADLISHSWKRRRLARSRGEELAKKAGWISR